LFLLAWSGGGRARVERQRVKRHADRAQLCVPLNAT
jgi:hypothetical protein